MSHGIDANEGPQGRPTETPRSVLLFLLAAWARTMAEFLKWWGAGGVGFEK